MDPGRLSLKDVVSAITPLVLLVFVIYNLMIGNSSQGIALLVVVTIVFMYCLYQISWAGISKKEYGRTRTRNRVNPDRAASA